jgi:hypothetical protein
MILKSFLVSFEVGNYEITCIREKGDNETFFVYISDLKFELPDWYNDLIVLIFLPYWPNCYSFSSYSLILLFYYYIIIYTIIYK